MSEAKAPPINTSLLPPSAPTLNRVWVLDNAVVACSKCNVAFTFFNRRHHCRRCGQIYCGTCSSKMRPVPVNGYPKPVRVCDACFKFEAQRDEFESRLVSILLKGNQFKKHAAGLGMPRVRWIKLTPDKQQLTWHPDGEPPKADSYINIDHITTIEIGQNTKAFQRTGRAGHDSLCFSIVASDRTLDLECESPHIRDNWIRALQCAIVFLPRVSREELRLQKRQEDEQKQKEKYVAKVKQTRAVKAEKIRNKYNIGRES